MVKALLWYSVPHTLGKGGSDAFIHMSHRDKEALEVVNMPKEAA